MKKRLIFISLVIIALVSLTSCSGGKPEEYEDLSKAVGYELSPKSILNFEGHKGTKRLNSDILKGEIPTGCQVMYDEEGGRPEVTLTKKSDIMTVYSLLGKIEVGKKSNMSVTDSYHHVSFRLKDGKIVNYMFEGTELLNLGESNYSITGGSELWQYVRALQEKKMK